MLILFILFMTDFILTYLGISSGIITEGNALMVWLFKLPFVAGLIIRLLMSLIIIYVPIQWIRKGKVRPFIAKTYYGIAYSVNFVILGMHLYWIIMYSTSMKLL